MPTFCRFSERFCAVTMTSSSAPAPASAPTAASGIATLHASAGRRAMRTKFACTRVIIRLLPLCLVYELIFLRTSHDTAWDARLRLQLRETMQGLQAYSARRELRVLAVHGALPDRELVHWMTSPCLRLHGAARRLESIRRSIDSVGPNGRKRGSKAGCDDQESERRRRCRPHDPQP